MYKKESQDATGATLHRTHLFPGRILVFAFFVFAQSLKWGTALVSDQSFVCWLACAPSHPCHFSILAQDFPPRSAYDMAGLRCVADATPALVLTALECGVGCDDDLQGKCTNDSASASKQKETSPSYF